MSARIAAIASLVTAGCVAQHAHLAPLPDNLSPSQRVAMFQQLRPAKETTTTADGELIERSLILANKVEVVIPEDLGAVVAPDSDTMIAAREGATAQNPRTLWTIAYFAAGIVDVTLISGAYEPKSAGTTAILLSSATVAGVVSFFVARHYGRRELDAYRRAFAAYPRDLGARLNVCAHGYEVVPCEGSSAPAQTTMQPFRP